ncbi:Uncharacterised protein [Mycobacteroides abscessus subsp. abscessus]|nr:Uncharacterised protein [Mycobacteroides abscessus subsp. abscessus]
MHNSSPATLQQRDQFLRTARSGDTDREPIEPTFRLVTRQPRSGVGS